MLTAEEAALAITSYSPELMVSPVYSAERMGAAPEQEAQAMLQRADEILPRLHALVIGPGLGRDPSVLEAVARIVASAKARQLPLVIDADGLWLIKDRPELVRDYERCVLTPNAVECRRLAEALGLEGGAPVEEIAGALGNVTVLRKGLEDEASDGRETVAVSGRGSPRRSGGIGDVLSGTIGLTMAWAHLSADGKAPRRNLEAVVAASGLVKAASCRAFAKWGRSSSAIRILEELGAEVESACPSRSWWHRLTTRFGGG